jgi:uncharacterized repeat protein (TIGR01451 family)
MKPAAKLWPVLSPGPTSWITFVKLALFLCVLFGLALLNFGSVPAVRAATTITVTTTSGLTAATGAPAGTCTLRDALTAANTNTNVGSCNVGGGAPYTIVLAAGATYNLTVADNVNWGGIAGNNNGLPVVNAGTTVIIEGNGATLARVGGAPPFRIFANAGNLTLNNLIVSGGNLGNGFIGGGVANVSALTVNNSTFTGNSIEGGGAISNQNGTATITNSTFTGNTAIGTAGGGAIHVQSGTVSVINSTIANNITTNSSGGGIRVQGGVLNLKNTIIAGNTAPTSPDLAGNFTSQGYNLVQNQAGANGFVATDLPNGTNPLLAGLANNGGPTPTLALPVNSPAVNAVGAGSCSVSTDQRGVARPQPAGGLCDIGAFELGLLAPTISKAFGAASLPLNGTTSLSFTLTNPNPGLTLTGVSFTDNLPAGLVVATPNNLTTNCGPTAPTATAGANTIVWAGGSLAANATCTITLNVTGTTNGVKNNQTGPVSSTESGAGLPSNIATLVVTNPNAPTLSKSFNPSSIKPGELSTLSFVVTNPGSAALTNISFTDNLPSQVTIAATPALINSCGGAVIASVGGSSVQVSGVNLATGKNCTISVNVTSSVIGNWTNLVSSISSTETGSTPLNAVAVLRVGNPQGGKPADLIAQLRVSPDRLASTDAANLISYTLILKNVGEGSATSTSIRFPLVANLELGFASFTDPRLWVSAIVTDTDSPYLKINLPDLDPQQVVTATVVFRPAANAQAGARLFTRYLVFYDDASGTGKQIRSNGVRYSLSGDGTNQDASGGAIQLFNPATFTLTGANPKLTVNADFYIAGEKVSFWYTDKDNLSTALLTAQVNPDGTLSVELSFAGVKAGETYTVAGYGERSGVTGSLVITVSSG